MMQSYTRGSTLSRQLRQLGLTALLVGGATVAAQAQTLNYTAFAAQNVAGTFTDLAATGTVITTTSTDDANSAAQPIGFNFSYNGATFSQFVLNTNGLIRLGADAPSAANLFAQYENGQATGVDPVSSTAAADVNLLMPFNFDLESGTGTGGAEYRVTTTGTAPNQVCTIQWKNVRDKTGGSSAQYDNFTFQVKLYQTTNYIEFVYGTATPATTGTDIARYPTVGIKGSGSASGQDVLANKTSSAAAWSTTTFITGQYGTSTHNYRRTAGPDPGRTYRFRTALPNDASVAAIYTYGEIATPAALPHAVRTVITNVGTTARTNLVATLNVTGANTFTDTKTIATLAAGASTTVTFASYPATLAVGTNTVTVSLPADDNTANNTASYGQVVTTNRISYTDPNGTFDGSVGVGQPGGALAAKYTLSAATTISDVVLNFSASTFASTNYQVVLYDATGTGGIPGNILYTSPTQNRTAAASTPTIAIPNVQVPAAFYIGVKELDNNPSLNYQTEDPLRTATYYYSLDGATAWTSVNNTSLRTRLAIEFGTITPGCTAPTAVAVSNLTTTTATITFTPAASGSTSYQIVYGPIGFNPATSGTTVTATTSPVTLTGLASSSAYQVYVRSTCTTSGFSLFTAAVGFTTACDPTVAVTGFPYSLNFDTLPTGQLLPCGVTVLDANADGATWAISKAAPNSGVNSMRYTSSFPTSPVANDWFFTPPLATTAGTRYQLAFRYRGEGIANSPSTYIEKLEVKSGTAATAAGMTNTLYTNNNITNTSYQLANGASTPAVAVLQPAAGNQFIGFHAISDANQGNLYVDDLSISTVLATSEVLMRAITVFPNPSTTGVFDLEIHGANAKGALDVTVTNTLGQRVYTGSARDNYTNTLDLSTLAAGIYHLQVRTGDQYLTRQVSIVK
ncbi:T9SS type A sorting domain-containing protein [Hymenobacter sp. HMF4947]|uniref:T9SS type A sorting domain-containing protein n=1 Tax=Hymenobacter ginkgonis TaxID=2682976 RepID=A0A7K1TF09_9BACT|nr:T9SS type A sorting domain-containing protein [Hymenobacter ginkgonis]MVN76882.1 T9SS type A sorting domain-containing protein [Hymenobacter ginkgonis]